MIGNVLFQAPVRRAHRAPSAPIFFVAVHDVAPDQRVWLEPLLAELTDRVGPCFALGLTPRLGGRHHSASAWGFARDTGAELLLHGLTHRRAPNASPVSWVNHFADEWTGKSRAELDAELALAGRLVREAFGRAPDGVSAPCWRWGGFDADLMARHQLGFAVGFREAWSARRRMALSTASWDWGLMTPAHPVLSRITAWPGWGVSAATSACPLPSLVFHPADVRRGLHHKGLRRLDRWLAAGAEPARFGDVLA